MDQKNLSIREFFALYSDDIPFRMQELTSYY